MVIDNIGSNLTAVRTQNPGFARSHLGAIFTDHDLITRKRCALRFEHRFAALADLIFNIVGYGADVELATSGFPDFYLLQLTLSGAVTIKYRQLDIDLPAGSIFVVNPEEPFRKRWSPDARQLIVKIPRMALADLVQKPSGGSIRFEPCALDGRGRSASLARNLIAVCNDVAEPDSLFGEMLVARAMQRMLIAGILATMRHDQAAASNSKTVLLDPRYIRQAEEFVRAQIAEALDVNHIASAVNVSVRTLQDGLKRHRGTTPSHLIRDARLDAARNRLADQDASVTGVALEVGFTHLGRFSQAYAKRFGELPSYTQRREAGTKRLS